MTEATPWSRATRIADLESLARRPWDVVIIGGGITGAGIALDAASRGFSTALVEKADFSSGTSSRSSKLVHGGLRYLRERQFRMTMECSREKRLLQRLCPHLIETIPFLLPTPSRPARRALIHAGLWAYDLAGGQLGGTRHAWLPPAVLRERVPCWPSQREGGAFRYFDARADDCRLTLHVLARAVSLGALAVNHAEVVEFETERGRVCGLRVRDTLGGRRFRARAHVVVNATGVWCDAVRAIGGGDPSPLVRPSKGIHLVVPRARLGLDEALVLAAPGQTRTAFVVPWGDHALVGTTDAFYQGDLDTPRAAATEVSDLLGFVNLVLPAARLRRADVVGAFAGLRPLLAGAVTNPSAAPRDEVVLEEPPGLITVTGGKLTTYRRMAQRVVDRVARRLRAARPCRTHRIDLFAASPGGDHLLRSYGSRAPAVRRFGNVDPSLRAPIAEGLPWTMAEAVFAVEHERAVTLADVLCRRTRVALFCEDRGMRAARRLAEVLAPRTGWAVEDELARFAREAESYEVA